MKFIRLFVRKIISTILTNFKFEKFNKESWHGFKDTSQDLALYKKALIKTENVDSDNLHKQSRFLDLINVTRDLLNKNYLDDFVEVGCWRGHSSYILSELIQKSHHNLNLHIFDSFEGLSQPTTNDHSFLNKGIHEVNRVRKMFSSDEDFVKNHVLTEFKFVKTYRGFIPSEFHKVEDKKFSLVHIDVDLYEPTMESLIFFYPRLTEGGIIICDDYQSADFSGAKMAWDDFFSKNQFSYSLKPVMSSAIAIK